MKLFQLAIIVGVVSIVAASSWAITFDQSYTGPIKLKFSNYESTRLYMGPDGTYTADSGPGGLNLSSLKSTAWTTGAAYGSIAPPGGTSGEDGWGLFELTTILGQNSSTGQYNIVLWEKGGASDTRPDIVGMFYGLVDQQVTLTTRGDGLLDQEVWAAGDNFKLDLYEVPNGTATLQAPTARTAVDKFPGWTEGMPILQGDGLADQILTPIAPTGGLKYWSKTILNPATGQVAPRNTAEGSAKLFVEWYNGSDFDMFHVPGADLEFTTHVYGNDTAFNWTASSDDPAFGGVVPEPMTMTALLLTVGAVGAYIRRRK